MSRASRTGCHNFLDLEFRDLVYPCNRGIMFYHSWVMEHLHSEVGSGSKTIASKFPLLLACAKFLSLMNKFKLITSGDQGIYLSCIGVSYGGTPLLLSFSETMER